MKVNLAVLSSGAVYYIWCTRWLLPLVSVEPGNRTSAHKQMEIHSGLSYKIYLLKITIFHCYAISACTMTRGIITEWDDIHNFVVTWPILFVNHIQSVYYTNSNKLFCDDCIAHVSNILPWWLVWSLEILKRTRPKCCQNVVVIWKLRLKLITFPNKYWFFLTSIFVLYFFA